MTEFTVAAFYRFTPLPDFEARRSALSTELNAAGVKGTVLLAEEGVNGTIAGTPDGIAAALASLRALPGCSGLTPRLSYSGDMPFLRLKVRLKKEIVTMGVDGVDPTHLVGTYVAPEDWNTLLDDPDTVVIDTRNAYETAIGTFEGAIDPETDAFGEFPAWFRTFRATRPDAKVAMFCTGGIRCEKATSFLKSEGVEDVFHLKGGILSYLETVPEADSKWRGDCFVFDQRVSVRHGLEPGDYALCHACQHPVSPEQREDTRYVQGVSCPECHAKTSPAQKTRFAERQKQMRLAAARGETHIGTTTADDAT